MAEELKLIIEADITKAQAGVNSFTDTTDKLVDNLNKLGPAASNASSGIDKVGTSAKTVAPASQQASTGLQGMVSNLTKLPPLANTSAASTQKFVTQLKETNSVLLKVSSGTPQATSQILKLQLGVSKLGDTLETLKAKANVTRDFINTEKDTAKIAALQVQLTQLEAEILRVQNIGKEGVAISSGNFSGLIGGANEAFSALRRIAFVLPGIGVAGILGGLTDAIISLAKELFNVAEGFDEAELQAAQFQNQLKSLNDFIESTKGELDFSAEIDKLKAQLTFGPGFNADILGKAIDIKTAEDKLKNLNTVVDIQFNKLNGLLGNATNVLTKKGKELFDSFGGVPELISDELIQKLDKNDQQFLNNIKAVSADIAKVNKERGELQRQIEALNLQKQVDANNESLKQQKDAHDKLLKENEDFIKRTITLAKEAEKFFNIPINLRISDFETQTEQFKKALETITGIRNFEIKIKPTIELPDVKELPKEQVEKFFINVPDAFQDAINKGILEFKNGEIPIKPDLDPFSKEIQAALDRFSKLGIDIPLNIQVDAANGLKGADLLIALLKGLKPAELEKKLNDQLQSAIDNAITNISTEAITGLAESIGTALTGGDFGKGIAEFGQKLGSAVEALGKQIIALGIAALLAKKAIQQFVLTNPALVVVAGAALVLIGAALKNLAGKGLQGFAKGGRYPVGQDIMVGERGREIVRFDRPGTIIPNHQTESILSSSVRDYHNIKNQFFELKKEFYSHRDSLSNFKQNIKEHFTSLKESVSYKISSTLQYISESHKHSFSSIKNITERIIERSVVINNNFFNSESFSSLKTLSPERIANILKLPKFANAGAVFAPTLALLGEGFGVSRSNPELVGTASQLKGIQGGAFDVNVNVNGDISFDMGKLAIALNREERSHLRTNGKKPF